MTDEPICKICGHHANYHGFATPVKCSGCPDRICQDGEDGRRFRGQPVTDEKVWPKPMIRLSHEPQIGMRIKWKGKIYTIASEHSDGKGNKQITLLKVDK